MASMRARSLFLLENTALKCDLSGVGWRSKHDVLQSRYQLGEFHHLCNDLKERFHQIFRVLQNVAFSIWLYSAGYTAVHFTHLNKFSENNIRGRKAVCDTEVSPACYTFKTICSVPCWSQFGSLEDCYIHNDSNALIK